MQFMFTVQVTPSFIITCKAMREIQEYSDSDSESSSKAYSLLSAITKYSFASAMGTVSKVFSLPNNLSTSLQSETIDLVYFLKHADDFKSKVRDLREAMIHPLLLKGPNVSRL